MGQLAWVSLHVPVFSWVGNSLIGSRFILAPEFYSSRLRDTVGQFNQALFLLRLRIMDGDHARFAHAHRRASLTPGTAASEDVACCVQDAADGTGSDAWQTASAQGPLQQVEGPCRTLILLSIRHTPQFLQDVLPLEAAVGGFAPSSGSNAERCESLLIKAPDQLTDTVGTLKAAHTSGHA
jgi:hypothetical protein